MIRGFFYDLCEGWRFFCANPVSEALYSVLFFVAGLTGLFLGPAAIMWLWHLNPDRDGVNPLSGTPFASLLNPALLTQRFLGPRLASTFWLGLLVWAVMLFLATFHLFEFIPLGMLLVQPIWLTLVLADRFGLSFGVACRVTLRFFFKAPARALMAMTFGFIACSGVVLAFIGLFVTLPLANRALLRWLDRCHADLAAAVQESLP